MNTSHNEVDNQNQTTLQKESIDNSPKVEMKVVSDKKDNSTKYNKVSAVSTDSIHINSKALQEKISDICFGVNYII